MSESRDILADVVDERQVWSGDTLTNLTTGKAFQGELEQVPDIEASEMLGRDARESILLHVGRVIASDIKLGTRISGTLLGAAVLLKVLRRSDNPTDPQVEFGMMKLTDQDS